MHTTEATAFKYVILTDRDGYLRTRYSKQKNKNRTIVLQCSVYMTKTQMQ